MKMSDISRPRLRRQRGQQQPMPTSASTPTKVRRPVKHERRTKRKRGETPQDDEQVKIKFHKKTRAEVASNVTPNKNEDFECGICFDKLSTRGKIDCCDHKFCHSCIKKWLTRASSCPHCKREVKVLSRTNSAGQDADCQEKVKKRVLKDTIEQEEGIDTRNNLFLIVEQLSHNVNIMLPQSASRLIPNLNWDINRMNANAHRLRSQEEDSRRQTSQSQHHILLQQLLQRQQQQQQEQQRVYANVRNHMHVHSRYSSASSDSLTATSQRSRSNIASRYSAYHHSHTHNHAGLHTHGHMRQGLNCVRCGGILYGTTAQGGYCHNCRIQDEYNLDPFNSVYPRTEQYTLVPPENMAYASQCVPFSHPAAAVATLLPQLGQFSHVVRGNSNLMGSIAVFNPL